MSVDKKPMMHEASRIRVLRESREKRDALFAAAEAFVDDRDKADKDFAKRQHSDDPPTRSETDLFLTYRAKFQAEIDRALAELTLFDRRIEELEANRWLDPADAPTRLDFLRRTTTAGYFGRLG